ncbi:MAG: hypothetical protein KAQ75_07740, partial [Bacteroidales bacterium]|nr:hypothetical protein [Bacteroidales bacterium]
MKRFVDYLKKNYKYIFRAFLFIVTIALIVYIFPREGKFKYEFQKGRPWLHENLFAPFDFPIYKSDKQLQDERDSTLLYFSPYFKYDSTIFITETSKFLKHYSSKQEEFVSEKTEANSEFNDYRKQVFIKNSDGFREDAIQIIEEIY